MNDADLKQFDKVFRGWTPKTLHWFFGLSMLGAIAGLLGIFGGGAAGLKLLPPQTLMLCLGSVGFALFFPFFLFCALTRYVIRRLDDLESRINR